MSIVHVYILIVIKLIIHGNLKIKAYVGWCCPSMRISDGTRLKSQQTTTLCMYYTHWIRKSHFARTFFAFLSCDKQISVRFDDTRQQFISISWKAIPYYILYCHSVMGIASVRIIVSSHSVLYLVGEYPWLLFFLMPFITWHSMFESCWKMDPLLRKLPLVRFVRSVFVKHWYGLNNLTMGSPSPIMLRKPAFEVSASNLHYDWERCHMEF